MKFVPKKQDQVLRKNNHTSAVAIGLYLKDHTFMSWKTMMKVWYYGYESSIKYSREKISIIPEPRINGGFWGGGGYGSPRNYTTTIQYLVDRGFVTFTHVNGFRVLAATKKLKSTSYHNI